MRRFSSRTQPHPTATPLKSILAPLWGGEGCPSGGIPCVTALVVGSSPFTSHKLSEVFLDTQLEEVFDDISLLMIGSMIFIEDQGLNSQEGASLLSHQFELSHLPHMMAEGYVVERETGSIVVPHYFIVIKSKGESIIIDPTLCLWFPSQVLAAHPGQFLMSDPSSPFQYIVTHIGKESRVSSSEIMGYVIDNPAPRFLQDELESPGWWGFFGG